jgi:hypothetical protein
MEAIKLKMQSDELSEADIKAFMKANGGGGGGAEGGGAEPEAVPIKFVMHEGKKVEGLQRLHWKPINRAGWASNRAGQSSPDRNNSSRSGGVTGPLSPDGNTFQTDVLSSEEVAALKELFQKKQPKSKGGLGAVFGSKKKRSGTNSDSMLVLEQRRSQNIMIILNGIRKLFPESEGGYDVLAKSIATLDDSKLELENLEGLQAILPTGEELKMVHQMKREVQKRENEHKQKMGAAAQRGVSSPPPPRPMRLGQVEKFWLGVCDVPQLSVRIELMHFRKQFHTISGELEAACKAVSRASEQVMASERLAAILQKVLAVGNVLNSGTTAGNAQAFHIDSLHRLTTLKGADSSTNVLDYVTKSISESRNEQQRQLVRFFEDVPDIAEAGRTPVGELRECFEELKERMRQAQEMQAMLTSSDAAAAAAASEASGSPAVPPPRPMGRFLNAGRTKLQLVDSEIRKLQDAVTRLARYFGEDVSRFHSHSTFQSLARFITDFQKSLKKLERMEQSKARELKSKEQKKTKKGYQQQLQEQRLRDDEERREKQQQRQQAKKNSPPRSNVCIPASVSKGRRPPPAPPDNFGSTAADQRSPTAAGQRSHSPIELSRAVQHSLHIATHNGNSSAIFPSINPPVHPKTYTTISDPCPSPPRPPMSSLQGHENYAPVGKKGMVNSGGQPLRSNGSNGSNGYVGNSIDQQQSAREERLRQIETERNRRQKAASAHSAAQAQQGQHTGGPAQSLGSGQLQVVIHRVSGITEGRAVFVKLSAQPWEAGQQPVQTLPNQKPMQGGASVGNAAQGGELAFDERDQNAFRLKLSSQVVQAGKWWGCDLHALVSSAPADSNLRRAVSRGRSLSEGLFQ